MDSVQAIALMKTSVTLGDDLGFLWRYVSGAYYVNVNGLWIKTRVGDTALLGSSRLWYAMEKDPEDDDTFYEDQVEQA